MNTSKTNITIWGDSWGVPNYAMPLDGFTADGHTEYHLKRYGYNVTNLSENGRGNFSSIAKSSIKKQYECDYIVWFHTELPRDFNLQYLDPPEWTYNDLLEKTAHKVYKWAADAIVNMGNPKVIVVEGQAPLHEIYKEYITPDHIIEDWRSQLLKESMPYSHLVSNWNILEDKNNRDPIQLKNELFKDAEMILDAMKENEEHFKDNCHPGNDAHQQLSKQIHNIIISNNNDK